MSSARTLRVDASQASKRVDVVVGEALSLSRAKLKALFEAGSVRVNGKRVKKGETLSEGDEVSVTLSDEVEAPAGAVADDSIPLVVLYEDDALVFVEKPAGVPSQPLEPGERGTVANALAAKYPGIIEAGHDPREAGLCHRLDVETSGVLLAAKTRVAWDAMRRAFSDEGAVDKKYLALVSGPLADEGEIDLPLAHAGNHVRPNMSGEGRPARSTFRTVKRQGPFALVEVTIATGVLHQVRAHLAAVGAPIVGDTLYGGEPMVGLSRFFLHAASLQLEHPSTQRVLKVESPLPAELQRVLELAVGNYG